jgi:hypothetical protein
MDEEFVNEVHRFMHHINKTDFGTSIISDDYSRAIFDAIAEDVAQDILECTTREDYNDDDVRLAVSRVLVKKLGIEL